MILFALLLCFVLLTALCNSSYGQPFIYYYIYICWFFKQINNAFGSWVLIRRMEVGRWGVGRGRIRLEMNIGGGGCTILLPDGDSFEPASQL